MFYHLILLQINQQYLQYLKQKLATNASLNAKIDEAKNEIPSITNLANATDLTAVENKIPNIGDLVKKSDLDA